jgi:hypothetical protein
MSHFPILGAIFFFFLKRTKKRKGRGIATPEYKMSMGSQYT